MRCYTETYSSFYNTHRAFNQKLLNLFKKWNFIKPIEHSGVENHIVVLHSFIRYVITFNRKKEFVKIKSKSQSEVLNSLSASPTKWSNTLKQFVGKLPTNCLSVFDHFLGLALKELTLKNTQLR